MSTIQRELIKHGAKLIGILEMVVRELELISYVVYDLGVGSHADIHLEM